MHEKGDAFKSRQNLVDAVLSAIRVASYICKTLQRGLNISPLNNHCDELFAPKYWQCTAFFGLGEFWRLHIMPSRIIRKTRWKICSSVMGIREREFIEIKLDHLY